MFRTENFYPAHFKVVIKYIAQEETSGGSYSMILDRNYSVTKEELFNYQHTVSTGPNNTTVITRELGNISFSNGSYTLKIVPVDISKAELMKLLEIQLIPLDK